MDINQSVKALAHKFTARCLLGEHVVVKRTENGVKTDERPLPLPPTGSVVTVITAEIFRQSSRPAAFMVGGSVHWLSNFTVGLVFPFLEVSSLYSNY